MNKDAYRKYANDTVAELRNAILDKVAGRNIILYGAGCGALWLKEILTEEVFQKKVSKILDSSTTVQGQCLFGIIVEGPEAIKSLDLHENVILISAINYSKEISQMLCMEYHLEQGQHFFNYTHLYRQYYYLYFDLERTLAVFDLIDNTSIQNFPSIVPNKTEERIGILVNYAIPNGISHAAYTIALYLLMRRRGYNVRLVLDDTCDVSYYPTYHTELTTGVYDSLPLSVTGVEIMKTAYDSVFAYLENRIENVVCERMSQVDVQEILLPEDLAWIDSYSEQTYLSTLFYKTAVSKAEYIEHCRRKAGYVSSFVKKSDLSSLVIYNGMQLTFGIYTYICQKNGIRTPSYDGALYDGKSSIKISSNKCCCHLFDIRRAILEHRFSRDEQNMLVDYGQQILEKRIHTTVSSNGTGWSEYADQSFQPDVHTDFGAVDIVMPVNLPIDAAAIGVEGSFCSIYEWLMKTLEYILTHTSATVLVRMHPVGSKLKDSSIFVSNATGMDMNVVYEAYDKQILSRFGDNKRLIFVSDIAPCNTYDVIQRCKLVLPYTSTTGIEAALMEKPVLVAQNNYYSDLGFVYHAHSIEEYFSLIHTFLEIPPAPLPMEAKKVAYMTLACTMHLKYHTHFVPDSGINTDYTSSLLPWQHLSLDELANSEGVRDILDVIGENVPSCVPKLRHILCDMQS